MTDFPIPPRVLHAAAEAICGVIDDSPFDMLEAGKEEYREAAQAALNAALTEWGATQETIQPDERSETQFAPQYRWVSPWEPIERES
jgi:hypothetical protein